LAKERIAACASTSVTMGLACGKSIMWKVVDKHVPPNKILWILALIKKLWLRDFVMGHHKKRNALAAIFLFIIS
jgi:hypothetical protein